MDSNKKDIFILLIGGIPGIGKSYLAHKIISEYKEIYDIKYLNFDLLENINKDNYLQYQQMRNDYLLKINEIFKDINNININNKALFIILDDNFFLKSMRKKIYNAILDILMQNNLIQKNINFYYIELFLKSTDINYCLKMNSKRDNNQIIPDNIIINMNNIFEYNSPYTNKNQTIIININNEENLRNINIIEDVLNNKKKYIIKIKDKDKEIKDKIDIKKDSKSELIDDIENIIRKEINDILKTNENIRKKGKEISLYKKEYMKKIINEIKNIEKNKNDIDDKNNDNKSNIYQLLNDCIMNNIGNISDKENYMIIIKEDFKNNLIERKLIYL